MLDPTKEPEFFVENASEHYRPQNYRADWEEHPALREWIAPGKNPKRARCTYCDIEMTADMGVLKSHGKGVRHKRRLMGEVLSCSSRYNKNWENDPDYRDWIRPGRVVSRAECAYCDVEFVAESTVIRNHAKSKRHHRGARQAQKLKEIAKVWMVEKRALDRQSSSGELERKFIQTTAAGNSPEPSRLQDGNRPSDADSDGSPTDETLTSDARNRRAVRTVSFNKHFDTEDCVTLMYNEPDPLADIKTEPVILSVQALDDEEKNSQSLSLGHGRNGDTTTAGYDGSARQTEEINSLKDLVQLESPCVHCQSFLFEDGNGRRLCVSCEVFYSDRDSSDAAGSWLRCGASGTAPDSVPPNTRIPPLPGCQTCVVHGFDLSPELQRLVVALRTQVSRLLLDVTLGADEETALLRLDKVLALLIKIKNL
ncbi:uncharacterized protein LOC108665026 [Hyalella azteca]|uniref:Uncharacterized protein LOC108665026 n=1 Tax=Hyalella azteca TaxID=294128 RepID=A0A8B7N084_HYAAZ|nr:uncharacterized protein LOC108665026 [Hyalella azteca]